MSVILADCLVGGSFRLHRILFYWSPHPSPGARAADRIVHEKLRPQMNTVFVCPLWSECTWACIPASTIEDAQTW